MPIKMHKNIKLKNHFDSLKQHFKMESNLWKHKLPCSFFIQNISGATVGLRNATIKWFYIFTK